MQQKWVQHLTNSEDQEQFKKEVLSSRKVLERLRDIFNEMERDLNLAEVSPKNYEIPNWDYRQAHNNGYRQCLNIVKRFTDLDQRIIRPNE